MWLQNGRRLLALEGRDISLTGRDIIFEGHIRNIEVVRYPSPKAAKEQFGTIIEAIGEDRIIVQDFED